MFHWKFKCDIARGHRNQNGKRINSLCAVKVSRRGVFQHCFASKRKSYGSVSEIYSARYCKAHTGGTLILQFLSFDVRIAHVRKCRVVTVVKLVFLESFHSSGSLFSICPNKTK